MSIAFCCTRQLIMHSLLRVCICVCVCCMALNRANVVRWFSTDVRLRFDHAMTDDEKLTCLLLLLLLLSVASLRRMVSRWSNVVVFVRMKLRKASRSPCRISPTYTSTYLIFHPVALLSRASSVPGASIPEDEGKVPPKMGVDGTLISVPNQIKSNHIYLFQYLV